MVFIIAEVFAENCIYTIKQQKRDKTVLWIRIKDLNKKLDIKNIFDLVDKEIKGRFNKDNCPSKEQIRKYKRHGSEFDKDVKFVYAREVVVIPIIIGGRSPKAIEFRSKLGFSQYDITLKKESSVLKSIMENFKEENMETQYNVLNYRIDLYFHDYKLAVEIDERGHNDRSEDYETPRQKTIVTELDRKYIRINLDEEGFNIFRAQN